jgi:hypothetical protein
VKRLGFRDEFSKSTAHQQRALLASIESSAAAVKVAVVASRYHSSADRYKLALAAAARIAKRVFNASPQRRRVRVRVRTAAWPTAAPQ